MSSSDARKVINPTTEEELSDYKYDSSEEVENKLKKAIDCFEGKSLLRKNKEVLKNAGEILRKEKEKLAKKAAKEAGKPIIEGKREIEICINICKYYGNNRDELLENEEIDNAYIKFEPIGPVLGIEPWNYPFYQVFRFAVPNITVGNPVVLKHDLNVLGCAKLCEEVFERGGIPEGGFCNLTVENERVSKIIENNKISMVMFTGSTKTGGKVAEKAGSSIKKTILELGGSDPFIVFPDVDIKKTAEIATRSRIITSGESCIASKRFMIHEEIYEEFLSHLEKEFNSLNIGNPLDEKTDIGPLIRKDVLDRLDRQVTKSIDMGAKLITGGKPLDGKGFFYEPTILTNIPDNCPVSKEETFGPVAAVFKIEDEKEAVKQANNTQFGLGCSIWTKDREKAEKIGGRIDVGMVAINDIIAGSIGSEPRLPFGGTKKSGYGRELGRHGLLELVNKKVIWKN